MKMELILNRLTGRQKEILGYKVRGLKQKEIADILGISQQAISKHYKAIKNNAEKTLKRIKNRLY